MPNVAALNKRHGISGAIVFERGPGGLGRALLTGRGGRAALMLHGTHVTEFQPDGHSPVLWLSSKSWFRAGKPIRGGVPVCWPWFGAGPASGCPNHGFARLVEWKVVSTCRLPDGRATITLSLDSANLSAQMKRWWPHLFELHYTITVGSDLMMGLTTRNLGRRPFTITEALHSYFAVSHVRHARVRGLEGAQFLDTIGTPTIRWEDNQPLTFAAETDRCYLDNPAECVLEDGRWGRRIIIAKGGSRSTVVWNPWIAKAERTHDFGDDEWPNMVCIETANAHGDNAVVIPGGDYHVLHARVCVRRQAPRRRRD